MGYLGDTKASSSVLDELAVSYPQSIFARLGMMAKYAMLNDKTKVLSQSSTDLEQTFKRDPTFCHHLAGIYSLLGDRNKALEWLEQSTNRGFMNYPLLAEKDPWLANIRSEERFKKLMERVKYEWEHFDA